MKQVMHLLFFFFQCFLFEFAFSQTIISGIINNYASVDSIYYSGSNCIVKVNNASAFNSNDKVLIIQMNGVVIDSANNSTFGNITAFGCAGNYEFSRINSLTGNDVTLCASLQKNYNTNYAVQLIFIPEYSNAIVNGTLLAQAWNGSTGGVLSFDVSHNLNLMANIDASEIGFAAGQSNYYGGVNCGQIDYYFSNASTNGVDKGKGICLYPLSMSRGKGAAANAGGGGNNHNAGGGGGSNFGSGGNGGKEWSGCGTGIANGGIGGNALPYSNASNKIFMGGGGGAGHNNSTNVNTPGGIGGGIIIIKAASINGNNYSIKANGESGPNPILIWDEGRGGGGGGGTILLDIQNYSGTVNLEVRGGDGGNSNTCCAGPGGGGGAGIVWFSTGSIPVGSQINLSGGNAGITNAGNNYGSSAGTQGANIFDLTFPSSICSLPLSVTKKNDDKENSISIFPNPSSGIFTINFNKKNTDAKICVYDVLGNCVLNKVCGGDVSGVIDGSTWLTINLSNQAKGIYFVAVVCDGEKINKKIIIQ